MASQPQPSISGQAVFRELSGAEMSDVLAHDLEQSIINMLASGEFKKRAKDMFLRTGKFGLGACFPVVIVEGQLRIKVFTSVESYRSNEKLPAPFGVDVNLQTGEMREDTEKVCEATTNVNRVIGTDVSTAVDKVRKEVGLDVLVPTRDHAGYIVNTATESEKRKADYAARLETRRATIAARKAAQEAEAANEAERERIAKEQEARGSDSPETTEESR